MTISMIAACGENNVIGRDNALIWHMPNDLKFFKEKTLHHHVIMGRRTFESFPGTLPKRTNVIITRKKNYEAPENCIVVHSLEEALDRAKDDDEPFIVGGEQIYRLGMEVADRIYLTRIHETFEGDAFFPEIDSNQWKEIDRKDHQADEKHRFPYSFVTFERK